jgi:SAM-dependent methyltransferase/chromosome segregation ATPase
MTEISAKEVFNQRLPLYAYLEPLLVGRRVLELGTGTGAGAAHVAASGASVVVGVDTDEANVAQAHARHRAPNLTFRRVASLFDAPPGAPFEVVLVPDAEALLRRPEAIPALSRLLGAGGRLVLVASSADRGHGPAAAGGVGYYELSDALLPHFAAVQMFGVTPFAAFGVVEFEAGGEGLRVDSRLVEGGVEPPSAYVAVAGSERAGELGYALVQVPFAPIEAKLGAAAEGEDRGAAARLLAAERRLDEVERRGRARLEESDARASELRRKVEDATSESDSAKRVVRAQGEEIEELRGRLRRASEDRASLDGELAKLRRALAEADESVMTLTRRTAEEMSAVAARLAAGLSPPAPVARPAPAEDVQRLREDVSEAEARASAAELRLEEVAAVGRERQAALDDVLERLRLAEETLGRERREVEHLKARLRDAGVDARTLDERESTIVRRDERIAQLEGEKQDLLWRLAELEEKLRQTIGRAVISDNTGRAQADELDAARSARARAVEEFHRAAGAHVDEVTALRASVAEQAALVAELEESVRVAEGAAEAATAEAATLRKNSKGLEEADRVRRTRLAELEGKLLRLEHEKKQAAAAPAASAVDTSALERRAAELARERDQAARERDDVARERDQATRERDQATRERDDAAARGNEALRARDEGRADLARLMGAAAQGAEALAKATDELHASRARAAALETEVGRLRAGEIGRAAGGNGHDAAAVATARELASVEAGLRDELAALGRIEQALAEEIAEAEAAPARSSLDVERGADAILMHTTLANYRRHAARLRDELEGIRRRLDSLSPSEISGYLEELGEDLAEMEE